MQLAISTYQNRGNFYLSSKKSVSNVCSKLELSNHLGNVLSVISDKVIPHPSGSTVAYYKADIMQAMDYSPFGVTLKGRNLKKTGLADEFRFGFNGMEGDDEMKGDGNSYDFGARMLDPRLGRFFCIDNKSHRFAGNSPYSYVKNRPLIMVDINGDVSFNFLNPVSVQTTDNKDPNETFDALWDAYSDLMSKASGMNYSWSKKLRMFNTAGAALASAKLFEITASIENYKSRIMNLKTDVKELKKSLKEVQKEKTEYINSLGPKFPGMGGGDFGGGGAGINWLKPPKDPILEEYNRQISDLEEDIKNKNKKIVQYREKIKGLEESREAWTGVLVLLMQGNDAGDIANDVKDFKELYDNPTEENFKQFLEDKVTDKIFDKVQPVKGKK